MDHAKAVKQFTEESKGIRCPNAPIEMDRSAVLFIIRMVMSELDELACTVTNNEIDREMLMHEALVKRDKCKKYESEYEDKEDKIGAQGDSMVDAWYYMLDIAAKHGINLSKIFEIVHNANLSKRDKKTGTYKIRESDGKVNKPEGWRPPDIKSEILRQTNEGSWN